MSNINAFRFVVHEKKITKYNRYINLSKICPLRAWPCVTQGTSFEKIESPGPKDAPCQILRHSSQCFVRRSLKKNNTM